MFNSINCVLDLLDLIKPAMDRWLGRADSLYHQIDRRCFAVACLITLRHCAQSFVSSQIESLDTLIIHDKVHAVWLEPVISLLIQVKN